MPLDSARHTRSHSRASGPRPSEALEDLIWIDTGENVPRYSVAAQFFSGESLPGKPAKVDVDDWLSENKGLDASYFYEDVIPMPSYGQVLGTVPTVCG